MIEVVRLLVLYRIERPKGRREGCLIGRKGVSSETIYPMRGWMSEAITTWLYSFIWPNCGVFKSVKHIVLKRSSIFCAVPVDMNLSVSIMCS